MKPHIITLLSILSLLSVKADENVLSRNPEWATEANAVVSGWILHDCQRLEEDGKAFIRMPHPHDSPFAKLSQRIALEDPDITALRVTATVRTRGIDSGQQPTEKSSARLRLYYHRQDSAWSFNEVLWPEGLEGAAQEIPHNEEWHRVTFELRRPAGADQVEVAIEVKSPAPGVDVADLVVTAIRTP